MNKIEKTYKILFNEYGEQGWWPIRNVYAARDKLTNEERFEIILGAILTQNTSWNNVKKALDKLSENNALNIKSIRKLPLKNLALLIKSSGYHNQKAKKLKELVKFLYSNKSINRVNLLSVWGIGNETADSILLYAYNLPYFVIDSYTKRIFSRIGLCEKDVSYDKLQKLFYDNLENNPELFNEYHALIVEHAKRFCRKKPECSNCVLKNNCNYFKISRKTY